ncbi:hypothetical protein [Chamaesiphon polymorphus]|uniref:Uncharacterized protein n=1 Tax=Chamaesiphon polymorphus CCALA 037 TaxID=2107692 RepID=A0A2T1GKW0_9CYAN|nr:hypothetical protein [Chamaesiphon polymorphus]PSB58413.1 hypothetical protein C7B77_04860 [Chamaesiphon polymorphus CCALA 037]
MKFNLITKASNAFDFASRRKTFTQLLSASTLAVGAISTISAVPARAISLAGGQVVWTGEVDNFVQLINPTPGDTIDTIFNNISMGAAMVSSATGPFTTTGLFDQSPSGGGVYPIDPSSVTTFTYVSGDSSNYTYELASDLDFAFANTVTLTVVAGTKFSGNINPAGTAASLFTNDGTGSFYTQGGVRTDVTALSFTLNDIGGGVTAGYSILASTTTTAVPEPFTIVGTLVGGTVAMRMRKKLATASQE